MLKKKFILILIPLFILSWSQGCSKVAFLDTSFLNSKNESTSTDSGNGGTYDGKLRVLHHYVDRFQCEGKNNPESVLISKDTINWVVIRNSKDKCAVVDQQPVTGVVYDDVAKQAQFEGHLYIPPKPYIVDPNEDPNLADTKPIDGICEDINGKCSLLASLQSTEVASYTSPVDVSVPASIYLLTEVLRLTSGPNGHAITIHGDSATSSILDGQNQTSILRLFGTQGSGPVFLQRLKFANGFVPYSFPPAGETSSSALENNLSTPLELSEARFENNVGGDIFQTTVGAADVSIRKTRFLGNAPKLWVVKYQDMGSGHLIIDETEISNNTITVAGGAIDVGPSYNGVALTMRNSLISRTVGGCAVYLKDVREALIENTTLALNDQQAINNTMTSIPSSGDIVINNSTIYDNGAKTAWGPSNIYADIRASSQKIQFNNSVIASSNAAVPNCFIFTDVIGGSHSLFNDNSCRQQGTGHITANPLLGPLANNGGWTFTMAPLPGSPLIDAGDNTTCLASDQRGLPRPVDILGGGTKCDLGAVEQQQ